VCSVYQRERYNLFEDVRCAGRWLGVRARNVGRCPSVSIPKLRGPCRTSVLVLVKFVQTSHSDSTLVKPNPKVIKCHWLTAFRITGPQWVLCKSDGFRTSLPGSFSHDFFLSSNWTYVGSSLIYTTNRWLEGASNLISIGSTVALSLQKSASTRIPLRLTVCLARRVIRTKSIISHLCLLCLLPDRRPVRLIRPLRTMHAEERRILAVLQDATHILLLQTQSGIAALNSNSVCL
jgi:hypothetical protein